MGRSKGPANRMKLKPGRPKTHQPPFQAPPIHARMIGTDAYAREVLREYRTLTRGLTLARLRASKARDLLPLETVVIEALQLLSEQVPQATRDILLLNRELKKKGVLVALRKLDLLRRHIKSEIHRGKGRPIVGRLGYEWATSRVPLGRRPKPAGKYSIQRQIGGLFQSGNKPARIVASMMAQSDSADEDRWKKVVYREIARIKSLSPRPVNIALARRAKRYQRQHPGLSAEESLVAVSAA